jgi:FKBP-type peptidyl-prolyl cis-trans isomerase
MKTVFKSLFVFSLILLMGSCKEDSIYSGFKKMESGAYMKFYSRSGSNVSPRLDDEVTFEMTQYFNDTMLFTTAGDKPMNLVLKKADFVGDVSDALLMMSVGDSAQLIVLSDSVFITTMQMEVPEQFAGKPILYDLKLLSVKPYEQLEAERMVRMDSLRAAERDFLAALKQDPNNVFTESGIIVLEKKGKARCAKWGDYVNFDFTMCGPSGDTIMNSFGVEPIEMQYGEEFLCEGFNTALGMVPVDGMMRFVIPSEMAFDSAGYQKYIEPYTPLVVMLKMNKMIDKDIYEKEQAVLKAKQEAENEARRNAEGQLIEECLKANGVTEGPTESGLYIIREEEGTGDVAQWGDKVLIHYNLCNLEGLVLESSYDYNKPVPFTVGNGEMIPAIEEAVLTMAPGAKVRLIVPSKLGFGEVAIDEQWLPAYTPIMIDLELVSIK